MASAANATCPGGNAIPAISSLPVPQDINVMVRPGSNASNHAMGMCCAPNPVHVTSGCPYLWCEVPRRYFNGSASHDAVAGQMSDCLIANSADDPTTGDPRAASWQFNTGARPGTATAKQLGLWALLVSGFMYLL
jgi:hypothetical protein